MSSNQYGLKPTLPNVLNSVSIGSSLFRCPQISMAWNPLFQMSSTQCVLEPHCCKPLSANQHVLEPILPNVPKSACIGTHSSQCPQICMFSNPLFQMYPNQHVPEAHSDCKNQIVFKLVCSDAHFHQSLVINQSQKTDCSPTPSGPWSDWNNSSSGLVSHCFYDAMDRPSVVFTLNSSLRSMQNTEVLTIASGPLGHHVLAEVRGLVHCMVKAHYAL